MPVFLRLLCRSVLIAVFLTHPVMAMQNAAADGDGCTGFRFNLDHELELFATAPQRIAASPSTQDVPALQRDRLYEVDLAPQAQTKFIAPPGKLTVDEGSYAGVLSYVPATSGVLRVTLNEAAWVDVIANGSVVQSRDHTGSASCKWLHKSVQFEVTAAAPLHIQISGSTANKVRLTLTSGS